VSKAFSKSMKHKKSGCLCARARSVRIRRLHKWFCVPLPEACLFLSHFEFHFVPYLVLDDLQQHFASVRYQRYRTIVGAYCWITFLVNGNERGLSPVGRPFACSPNLFNHFVHHPVHRTLTELEQYSMLNVMLINVMYISHNVCKHYLGNISHVLIQNIQQEILYLLFGVCYISAGGHMAATAARLSSALVLPPNLFIIYWSTSVSKLVLLSKNAQ